MMIANEVATKRDTGDLSEFTPFGATFETTIDIREGQGNYSLAQLFDSYIDYLKTADFLYYGTEAPVNNHNRIWIDTGHTNQEE